MYVPDFNVQQHYQLYRRTDSQRIGEWERGSGLRSPADTHAGRSQAHHVARVCPEPPSSNDTFATRLSLSDLQRTRDERRRGGAEDEIYCLSRTLSLYPPSPGGQLPSPLTGAPLPSSLPLSLALLCYNSRNICLWICNQLVKESRKHIHTNVAAGVKLIFTDIRSVRTYSPLIWSWRKRPERCQLILNSTRTAILNRMSKPSWTSSSYLSLYGCTVLLKPRSFTATISHTFWLSIIALSIMCPTSGVRNILIMSYEYINDKIVFTRRKLWILGDTWVVMS